MTAIGRGLSLLQVVSGILVLAAAAHGYCVSWGLLGAGRHILSSFLCGLAVTFTHSMTLFYLFGTAAEMRAASGTSRTTMDRMARCRRRAVLPLSLALASLAAAIILGGGSHTRALPAWVHHAAALSAVALNLHASWISIKSIAINESVMREAGES